MNYKTPLSAKTPYAMDPRPLEMHLTPHGGLTVLTRAFEA